MTRVPRWRLRLPLALRYSGHFWSPIYREDISWHSCSSSLHLVRLRTGPRSLVIDISHTSYHVHSSRRMSASRVTLGCEVKSNKCVLHP